MLENVFLVTPSHPLGGSSSWVNSWRFVIYATHAILVICDFSYDVLERVPPVWQIEIYLISNP